MNGATLCNPLIGLDDVRGEIIGPISHRYSVTLQTVENWPAHGRRITYPPRVHGFWSEEPTAAAALAEYRARNRRESRLGDGSRCVVTLEPVKQATQSPSL